MALRPDHSGQALDGLYDRRGGTQLPTVGQALSVEGGGAGEVAPIEGGAGQIAQGEDQAPGVPEFLEQQQAGARQVVRA